MTQKQINYLYNITILIHEDKWFGNNKKRRDREEVQEWVSKQLAETMNIYTIPIGSSWGVLVDEDKFNSYWEENSKIVK